MLRPILLCFSLVCLIPNAFAVPAKPVPPKPARAAAQKPAQPSEASVHLKLGKEYLDDSKYDKALAEFNAALKLEPRNDALFYRGRLHYYKDEYVDALKDLSPCVAMWTKNEINWRERGRVYWGLRQYDLAISDYDRAIALAAKKGAYIRERADCDYGFDNWQEAIANYTKAIALDPKDAESHINLGFAYEQLKQLDKALADTTKAIEIGPTSCHYARRAEIELALGDAAKALPDAEQGIKNKPDECAKHYVVYAETLKALGQTPKIPGLCKRAEELIAKDLAEDPTDSEALRMKVRTQALTGQPSAVDEPKTATGAKQ